MSELQDVLDNIPENIKKQVQKKWNKHRLNSKAVTILEHLFIAIVSVIWIGGVLTLIPLGRWLYFHNSIPFAKFCGILWLIFALFAGLVGHGVSNDY